MKKIAPLLVLNIVLIFASCSKNNDNQSNLNPPSNSIKKISETKYTNGTVDSFSSDFNYENGVLKSITDATQKLELFYNGTKISNTTLYTNNVVSVTYSLSYNGDLLESMTNTTDNYERTFYSYTNGILMSEKNQSLINTNWQTVTTHNYEFSIGNISTQYEMTADPFNYNIISKSTYDYDTKLNPMNYMNPALRYIIGLESCNFRNLNNEINEYTYSSSTSTTPILNFTYQINYNSQNLPIIIKKYTSNNILVSEATFEYY